MRTPHTIEVTADSVEQAVRKGLAQLGVGPSQVIVEVVEEASRGLFGLGAHPARVRLRVIGVVAQQPAPAAAAPPAQPSAAAPPAPVVPPPAPVTSVTPLADDADDADDADEADDDTPEANILPAGALDFDDDDFFDDDTFDEVIYGKDGAKPQAPVSGAVPVAAASTSTTDDIDVEAAAALLKDLLSTMGISATIDVHPSQASSDEAPQWVLNVQADEGALARLVGRRGDTLHALQHVTRLMVSRTQQKRANIIVDAGGWKVKRAEALRKLAQRMADQASRTGRTVVMEPMPPNERRIIHITLRKRDDVTTESVGEGEARKITIIPNPPRDA